MPSEKTKELLAGLGNIANKTRITEDKHTIVSNEFGEDAKGKPIYIDRLYSDLFGGIKLIQKNHKEYTGKVHKKRRLISKKSINGDNTSFYSVCYVTADNRWFDNVGLPIEAPKHSLDEEVKESNVEIVRMPPSAEEIKEENIKKAERAKAKEAAILANLR
jgi:hypothetical protein